MSIWDSGHKTQRQILIVDILSREKGYLHMNDLAARVGDLTLEPIPPEYFVDRRKFHDSAARRVLTDDIKEISLSDDFPKTFIRTEFRGVRLCTEAEIQKKADKQRHAAKKLLYETNVLLRKAGRREQLRMEEFDNAQ